jgi:2-polyprenyl-3-methyl-5-hydroxy-6-metoxy-1,4-benzoquinol methylase
VSTRDVFQNISDLDSDAIQRIVDRLEYRGSDPTFVRMRERYFDQMGLGRRARILDLGCGTGVVSRALAEREGSTLEVVGIDVSQALISAAQQLAAEKRLDHRIEFRAGDSHALEEPDHSYDFVVAHTLLSHVVDPAAVIAEASRVVRPDGIIAVFDGDYASLSYGAGDPALNSEIVQGILAAIVANPNVMRQVPAFLKDIGLKVTGFLPDIHAEAGTGAFFINLAESYIPIAVRAGTLSSDVAGRWLAEQRDASLHGTFFGSCNYYTYLAQKLAD